MAEEKRKTNKKYLIILFISVFIIFILGVLYGRYPQTGFIPLRTLFEDPIAQSLLLRLRLPRMIAALLVGMTLAGAGLAMQMLFSNPLVEPGFLGVSQGAAFGAALAIVFISNYAWVVQGFSMVFALVGMFASYLLAEKFRLGSWVLRLVMAGMIISAFFSSGVGIMKFVADPTNQLQEITFWLLGSLASITWDRLLSVIFPVIVGLVVLYLLRWRLNVLSLEDRVAFSLGVHPKIERIVLLIAAIIPVAATVSISGIVGWVGLLIPHVTRQIFGVNTQYSLPASMLLGGIFVMIADTISRAAFASEIPLGIITSLFGAILFTVVLIRRNTTMEIV
jgi:iron complex transport system permease protein